MLLRIYVYIFLLQSHFLHKNRNILLRNNTHVCTILHKYYFAITKIIINKDIQKL